MTLLSLDLRARSGFVFGLVSAALSAPCAFAGVNAWTPAIAAPDGAAVCALAVSPTAPATIYASAYPSVYRSSDGGTTWSDPATSGQLDSCAIAVDGADSERVYAAVPGLGVFRSLDGGATWNSASIGLPVDDLQVVSLSTTAADPTFLLAGGTDAAYRSLDRGDHWEPISAPPFDQAVYFPYLIAHPTVAGVAYAAVESGIYRTDDRGDHWTPAGDGLPSPIVDAVLPDPTSAGRVYVLGPSFGVFRSDDAGGHWTPLAAAGTPDTMVVRPNGDLFAFVAPNQVFRSHDHGATWSTAVASVDFPSQTTRTTFAASGSTLIALGYAGLQRSNDDGATWTDTLRGIHQYVLPLESSPRQPATIYTFQNGGSSHGPKLLRSIDGAPFEDFRVITTASSSATYIYSLTVDRQHANRMAVSATLRALDTQRAAPAAFEPQTPELPPPGPYFVPSGLVSEDGGVSWVELAPSAECSRLSRIEFDPFNTDRLFASREILAAGCASFCSTLRSMDKGASWECMDAEASGRLGVRSFSPSPFEPDVEIGWTNDHVVRSLDGGTTWTQISAPTPKFVVPTYFRWLSRDTVEFASSAGFYRSVDRGETWTRLDSDAHPFPPDAEPLDRFHPDALFAVSADRLEVLWKPADSAEFRSISDGLPGQPIRILVVDPVRPSHLLASLDGGGVWSYEIREPSVCVPSDTSVCLRDGRFRLEAIWHDFFGNSGVGHGEALSNESSSFWFFDPANLELFVKELDGLGVNHSFWTFFGALSNVEYTLLATDTATGAMHGYFNPAGAFASVGDVDSFPQEDSASAGALALDSTSRPIERQRAATTPLVACAADDTTLCLQQNRFAVSVTWRDFQDHTGVGHTLPLTADTGSFWFFDAANTELVLKVLDGTGTNDAFWVFYGSLSNVTFDITVTDTVRGDQVTYHNPAGQFASVGDIGAFPQEPH